MPIQTSRRRFLTGAMALLAAPAVVRAENLMPVRRVFIPEVFLPCYGQILRSADYPKLFARLGHHYGAGPTVGEFRMPDLRASYVTGNACNVRTNELMTEPVIFTGEECPAMAGIIIDRFVTKLET